MAKSKVNLWETHTSTVLSITLVMFLLGLCLMVEYHFYRMTHDMQERITFKVDLATDITETEALIVQTQIETMPIVKHVDYISQDQAAEIFSEEINEDFVKFLGYNPLSPCMMVNLKVDYLPDARQSDRTECIDQFTADVNSIEQVRGVNYQKSVVNELNDTFFKATWFLIVFMALLIVVSFLLIGSTIRIALYAQRDTIRTMRLVGAKRGFIARPFLMRSIWYGLLGGIIAIVVLAVAMGIFNQSLAGLDLLAQTHLPWYLGIAVAILVIGVILAYLATHFAVRSYLNKEQ